MFSAPPFPFVGGLPAIDWVPNCHSNPITQRVRRKRQRLPPSLLIENASDVFLAFQNIACPRRFRSRLATTRELETSICFAAHCWLPGPRGDHHSHGRLSGQRVL